MAKSEFKPLKSLTIPEFIKAKGLANLALFKSSDGASCYCAEKETPHIPVCFVSAKINGMSDVKPGAMISTVMGKNKDTGADEEFDVLHNAGGKEELGMLG